MNRHTTTFIDRSGLTESILMLEHEKSDLILRANLLQSQGEYEASTDKFAEAAFLEERLASELKRIGKLEKVFVHQFSALSCWVQAGDLHHALQIGQQLLESEKLTVVQRKQLEDYLSTLRERVVQWIREWHPISFAADA